MGVGGFYALVHLFDFALERQAALLTDSDPGYIYDQMEMHHAREKKATMDMDTYWVPGVNSLGTCSRWAFVELTDLYDFENAFNRAIDVAAGVARTRRRWRLSAPCRFLYTSLLSYIEKRSFLYTTGWLGRHNGNHDASSRAAPGAVRNARNPEGRDSLWSATG